MTGRLVFLATVVGSVVAVYACQARQAPAQSRWKVGGVYSVRSEEEGFRIAKVLALDPGVVSVRIYKQSFPSRPQTVDVSSLTLGSIKDPGGFGIGHAPIAEEGFAAWKPELLAEQPVTEAELEGYRYWKGATK
jgi:hypothetical protein